MNPSLVLVFNINNSERSIAGFCHTLSYVSPWIEGHGAEEKRNFKTLMTGHGPGQRGV